MIEQKHTGEPWSIVGNSWQHTTIYDAASRPICRLDLEDWGVDEDNQAELERIQSETAALIAAAPKLLAALHRLWRASEGCSDEEINARVHARNVMADAGSPV